MSNKSDNNVEALVNECAHLGWDPRYPGFFACFNQGLYFEAHEVLEDLWMADRHGPNSAYHKGLIQMAGGFVHLQRNRLKPAVSLFDLAARNLEKYGDDHDGVKIRELLEFIADWRARVADSGFQVNPLSDGPAPKLPLPCKAPN